MKGHSGRQAGLSIIELLIGMALGLLLTGGIIQLFVGTKATYATQQSLSRVQEAGRFAVEFLKADIRMAGFSSTCAEGMPNPVVHLRDTGPNFDPNIYLQDGVFGWEYSGTGPGDTFAMPATLSTESGGNWENTLTPLLTTPSNQVATGSDVLLLRWKEPVPGVTGSATATNPVNNRSIVLNQSNQIGGNAVLYATNCDSADLFQNRSNASASAVSRGVGAAGNPPGNKNGTDWSASYGEDLQLLRLRSRAYYVGLIDGDGNRPALFRMDFGANGTAVVGASQELVEGVESMQVLYVVGAATDTNPSLVTQVVTADAVANWNDVLAVRVALLIRSTEPDVVINQLQYQMLDSSAVGAVPAVAPLAINPTDDRFQRKIFQFDVGVRNAIRVF